MFPRSFLGVNTNMLSTTMSRVVELIPSASLRRLPEDMQIQKVSNSIDMFTVGRHEVHWQTNVKSLEERPLSSVH